MWKRKFGLGVIAAWLAIFHTASAEAGNEDSAKRIVAAGYQYSVQVEKDGTVWSFGKSPGHMRSSQAGREKGGALEHIVQVSPGYSHAAAVDEDGAVWAWGNNESGQLGQGNEDSYAAAVQVPVNTRGDDRIFAVAAGYDHTLALSVGGKVWAWGSNRYGQLGDGTETDRNEPTRVTGERSERLDDVIAIAAGRGVSLALTEDGEVWTWGSYGKKDGEIRQILLEKGEKLAPLDDIVAIAAGYDHALALDRVGKVYAWGLNREGQLGVGKQTEYSLNAVEVAGLPALTAVSAGSQTSAALDEAGDIWLWGSGYPKRLQDKSGGSDRFIPERLTNGEHYTAISVGSDHGIALDDKDQMWVWGDNYYSQLGHAYHDWSFAKPVIKKTIQRHAVSASLSSVTVEELASSGKERVLKLSLRLKDGSGKELFGKWPTAEANIKGLDPIIEPFKLSAEGVYTAEIGIPYPYHLIHPKIEIRVDGETIAEATGESKK